MTSRTDTSFPQTFNSIKDTSSDRNATKKPIMTATEILNNNNSRQSDALIQKDIKVKGKSRESSSSSSSDDSYEQKAVNIGNQFIKFDEQAKKKEEDERRSYEEKAAYIGNQFIKFDERAKLNSTENQRHSSSSSSSSEDGFEHNAADIEEEESFCSKVGNLFSGCFGKEKIE